MSDARWTDIETDTDAAATHFSRAVQIYQGAGLRDDTLEGYTRRMAFMHAMHAGHTSLERVLLRIIEIQGEEAPSGRQWHSDLIHRAARATNERPAILPQDLVPAVDRTRRFRHFAAHAYDTFDVDDAELAVRAAGQLAAEFAAAIATYRQAIDP
jgi:hypothetical protein